MMQVSKKIPFEDPQILLTVRTVYIISNLLIIGIYLYIQRQINKKKGTSMSTLPFFFYEEPPFSELPMR